MVDPFAGTADDTMIAAASIAALMNPLIWRHPRKMREAIREPMAKAMNGLNLAELPLALPPEVRR
jgi:hypothetical protein